MVVIYQTLINKSTSNHLLFIADDEFNSNPKKGDSFSSEKSITTQYKILVIEDDPISQRVVQLMLENMGYSVTIVAKGTQALAIYQEFDLIVSDLGLPDISGTAICKTIRNQSVKADIPIIALTANNYNDEIAQAGFTEFMSKPVMQDSLEHNVKKCLAAKKN